MSSGGRGFTISIIIIIITIVTISIITMDFHHNHHYHHRHHHHYQPGFCGGGSLATHWSFKWKLQECQQVPGPPF